MQNLSKSLGWMCSEFHEAVVWRYGNHIGIIVKGFCCLPSTWGGAAEDQADRGRFPAGSSEAWWIHRMSVWSLWSLWGPGQRKHLHNNISGWWFQTCLCSIIYINIWDNPSQWLIFFKMVKTTNQILILYYCILWSLSGIMLALPFFDIFGCCLQCVRTS